MTAQLPFTGLAETRPDDATLAFIDRAAKVNVANDPAVKQYCIDQVWDAIQQTKTRRAELEAEWLAIQRMIVLIHDEGQRYVGRSNAYLPLYARIRKTIVAQITRGLFPSDEYMDVTDRERGDTEQAKACKEIIRYELECSARIREFIKPFVGQYVDLGISPLKAWYRTNKIARGKRSLLQGVEQYSDEGLTVSARSIFNVLVYPEWAEHERDLRIVAERLEIPYTFAAMMMRTKRWVNVEEALQGNASDDQFDWYVNRTLADVASIPNANDMRTTEGSPTQAVIAVEAWCEVPLPSSMYAEGEDRDAPLPARVLFVNGVPVSVTRNPFYHQGSPFLWARDNVVVGSFYSNGAGRLVRYLQYLANDFANQTNDVGIYGLNPITIINTGYFAGPPGPLRPGGVMKVRDINEAIRFESPKVELVQHGMPLLQSIIAMANDGGGAPPVQQGTKAASTATSTQILAQNAMSPVQDSVEDIEAQVMVPLMKVAWSLSQQYRDKALIRRIAGGDDRPVEFTPSEIDIDPDFRFLSSSQSANRQARTQQITSFMQLAGALAPNLQAQGLAIDASAVLKRMWNDGLGFRGFDSIIKPLQQLMMEGQANGMGMLAPGVPGQGTPPAEGPLPPAEGGSAVPLGNVGGDIGEPVPGEGEAIQDVMANGEDIAANVGMGGLGSGLPEGVY